LGFRLGELAQMVGAELHGDAECRIETVATLEDATSGAISFLTNPKYRKYLQGTQAAAVILGREYLDECPVNALVSSNPYLTYARAAGHLFPEPKITPGRHETAIIAQSARIDPSAWIGPAVVVEEDVEIAAGVSVGPGSVVGRGVRIGEDSRLVANVTLCHGVTIGKRAIIHPGAVIGSDGFGLANDDGAWEKVPQLGGVRLGDDVEVGANTTIDRGALNDTVLGDGVKLDNQIQIAHNVQIGENTAIAGCVGIAGSTRIGRNCTIGGGVGIVGHLEISDNAHFTAQSLVSRSVKEPGNYSGNLPAAENRDWRRSVAHIRHLDDIVRRLKALEKQVLSQPDSSDSKSD
jgi:UDP-3-O-[3-hydroxymyristoyl] glucosamine N-acyltransferase